VTAPSIRALPRTTLIRAAAAGALTVVLIAVVLPRVTGADWGAIIAQLSSLTFTEVCVLTVVWLLGLYAHTFLATAALPNLSHRQALTLNLSGSAVSNVLPFGGALGYGLNYAMVRSWGLPRRSFGPFTAITALWNILAKLVLPIIAFGLLLGTDRLTNAGPQVVALTVLATTLLVVFLGLSASLANRRVAILVGRVAQPVVNLTLRLVGRKRQPDCVGAILSLREHTVERLAHGWLRMLVSMVAYMLLQALLLWAILHMLGDDLSIVVVFAGFAVGRALTLLVLTPGGAGWSETGTAALLIALGGDAAVTTAAVLLFSAFTFGLEIPVGGVVGLLWWRRAVAARRTA
jgi:putative heme transporter